MSGELLGRVRRLVDEAFEGDFSEEDWAHTVGGWRVILLDGDVPVAHAAVVPRVLWVAERQFRAGYVEGVATHPAQQHEGLGSLVMARATEVVRERFELGALSTGSRAFYERFGWEPWRGPSFVRDATELIRTADEDDGVMVLRFGSSTGIDLAAAIVCQRRSGDDW